MNNDVENDHNKLIWEFLILIMRSMSELDGSDGGQGESKAKACN